MKNITSNKLPTQEQVVRRVKALVDSQWYTPKEIEQLGVIIGGTHWYIYRLIKRGLLEAVTAGGGTDRPRYKVSGKVLKKFLRERYPFIK